MKASAPPPTSQVRHVIDAAPVRTSSESSPTFLWNVEEALTQVSYGFFRHIADWTQPDEAEMLDWWHQLLNSQVAIGALETECECVISDIANDDLRRRLVIALSRMSGEVVTDADG